MKKAVIEALATVGLLLLVAVLAVLYMYALGCFEREDNGRIRRLAREMMQREAVFAGHAEWRCGTNGEPAFHWKDCP